MKSPEHRAEMAARKERREERRRRLDTLKVQGKVLSS